MENREASEEIGRSPRNRENMRAMDNFQDRPCPDFALDPFHRMLRIVSVSITVLMPVFFLGMASQLDEDSRCNTRLAARSPAWVHLLKRFSASLGWAQYFNYPCGLTKNNVQRQYLNAVQMMVWMSAAFTIIMVGMAGAWLGLLPRPLVVFPLVLLAATLIYFIARSSTIR